MEIPRDARGADLIKSRYVAPQPLAPACSDGYSRIDLVEKVHLHVRFVVSKSETQKRPQRASQNDQLWSPRRACGRWRRSVDDPHPKPLRPVPPAQSRAFCYAQTDRPYREGPSTCAVCRQHARNAETAATHASKATATPSSDEIIIAHAQPAAVERLRRALRPFLRF